MSVTRQHLERLHPHFADETWHHDDDIERWSKLAEVGLPASRFNGSVERAHALYVAHQMAVAAHRRMNLPVIFAPQGRRRYPVFKSGGKLPVEFDTPDGERPTGGAWNSTTFGQQLHRMAKY